MLQGAPPQPARLAAASHALSRLLATPRSRPAAPPLAARPPCAPPLALSARGGTPQPASWRGAAAPPVALRRAELPRAGPGSGSIGSHAAPAGRIWGRRLKGLVWPAAGTACPQRAVEIGDKSEPGAGREAGKQPDPARTLLFPFASSLGGSALA